MGGGMLGMTLALRLAERGCRVTIIEAQAHPGGLASPDAVGPYTWDRFYHVILQSDSHLCGLLSELGLGGDLRWGRTRTGFYIDGRLHSLSNSVEYLTFPALSLWDKARLATTILRAAQIEDGRALEAIPVTDWLARWSGRRTLERIWLPLLKSKLGDEYRVTSAAFIWAVIRRLYAARRSGLKVEMFGYVKGGYDVILRRFADRLRTMGVEFLAGVTVTEVRGNDEAATMRFGDGSEREFTDVVLTLPASRVAALCPDLTEAERQRLGRVVYLGVVCASVLLKRPLGGFYVTNITDSGFPFTGVIEMTALVDRERFGGHTLVYLPRYLTQGDAFWNLRDAEVRELFVDGLARMYPDLRVGDVVAFRVSRAREVLALSTINYTETALPPLATSLPHVFVVNSAQIANGTLNNNEIVGLAERQAERLWERVGSPVPAGATA